ncbi:MAG: hypothetical protein U0168_04855 [Nannocystaceae bacterium]
MVGHTACSRPRGWRWRSSILCVARVIAAVQRLGGIVVVTVDHGNADQMLDRRTAASGPAPATACQLRCRSPSRATYARPATRRDDAAAAANLGWVAATCLELMGLRAGGLPAEPARALTPRQAARSTSAAAMAQVAVTSSRMPWLPTSAAGSRPD